MKSPHKLIAIFVLVAGVFLSSSATAETIYVKYRGVVNLDKFVCHNTASSFVNRICYLEENQYLIVLLKRTYYHYCRISTDTVNQWLSASSKGRFYGNNIKGNYDCRIGGVPKS